MVFNGYLGTLLHSMYCWWFIHPAPIGMVTIFSISTNIRNYLNWRLNRSSEPSTSDLFNDITPEIQRMFSLERGHFKRTVHLPTINFLQKKHEFSEVKSCNFPKHKIPSSVGPKHHIDIFSILPSSKLT